MMLLETPMAKTTSAASMRKLGTHFIRAWRKRRDLTIQQMVDRLPSDEDGNATLSIASLSRIERNQQPYSQEIVEAMANELDVSVSDLVGRNPDEPPTDLERFLGLHEEDREDVRAYMDFLEQRRRQRLADQSEPE